MSKKKTSSSTKKTTSKSTSKTTKPAKKTTTTSQSKSVNSAYLVAEQEEFHKVHPNANKLIAVFLVAFLILVIMYLYM